LGTRDTTGTAGAFGADEADGTVGTAGQAELTGQERAKWAEAVWAKIEAKISRTSRRIGATFPYVSIHGGKYNAADADWWTNGFWPGMLWMLYRETGEARYRDIAEACEAKLDEPLHSFDVLHHDVGFMWSLSAVADYKLTGSEQAKRRALTAASHLAGRFNPKGGFLRAWLGEGREGWAIVDCLMNLPLLYWASRTTGDPRFRHIAQLHADTALKEFLRPDGSAYHIVCFDPETGERTGALGGQGYAPDSAWSRGTAWALYGMALSHKYTGDVRYLDAAKRTAHYFVAQLPEDCVPYYDFRAPFEDGMGKDSSASAIAASGLLEIAALAPPSEASSYRRAACRILEALDAYYGAWDDPEEEGLLYMGTANFPKRAYVNVPIIYGDYFFMEAVAKLRGSYVSFW